MWKTNFAPIAMAIWERLLSTIFTKSPGDILKGTLVPLVYRSLCFKYNRSYSFECHKLVHIMAVNIR